MKYYIASTPRQVAVEEGVVCHSGLHKNHSVINAATSFTNFSINSVSKALLGKKDVYFLLRISLGFFCHIQNLSLFPHRKHKFLFYSSSCSVFAFYYEVKGTLSRYLPHAFLVKGIKRKHQRFSTSVAQRKSIFLISFTSVVMHI